jgi:hypothetical protein
MLDLLNLLTSLIPGLPTRPSTPFLELEVGSVPPSLNFPQLDFVKPSSGFHPVTWERVNCWDEQLAKVMFGYRCGIQTGTKFSPFMILIGRTPCLRVDNYLHSSTVVINDIIDAKTTTKQKMKLIVNIHENVLLNV